MVARTGLKALLGVLCALGLAQTAAAAPPPAPETAITFDDLPDHGALPPNVTRAQIAQDIVRSLQKAKAPPVYGFLNANALKSDPSSIEVLRIWRAGGNLLGNHTYSHMGASAVSAEAFEQDVLADEPVLARTMAGADWHWLRLPYLDGGDTPEKRAEITAFTKQHGYRIADVTIAFDDYDYNPPYARCAAKNDQAAIAWMKQNYMASAAHAIAGGQAGANAAFGRDIKHVMLLHIGAFEALMFPQVLDLLKERHFKLISLQEAQSDPAYAAYGDVRQEWGGLLPQRAMAAKNIPIPPEPDDISAKLKTLCQ